MARITPLIRERIRLLRDVLTVADFFFAAELAPYETSELIPKKGDAALAMRVLERALDCWRAPNSPTTAWKRPARRRRGTGDQSRPDVRAHPRGGVRPQDGAAAVRNAGCAGPRHLFAAHPTGHRKVENDMSDNRPDSAPDAASDTGRAAATPSNFVRDIILDDLKTGKYGGRVHTRFPPEPNGYLHIGHAKSICLNFGLAAEFGGKTNLRFDDTNPEKEETEYVDSIMENVRWLGFQWEDRLLLRLGLFRAALRVGRAVDQEGKAYVCDLTADEVRQYRGTLTEPGKESPYRNRSVEENLDLFERMRAGEFPDGSRTLRAKIDMAAEPEPARSGDVPHPARRASPHRQQVVHLPDVRLRARPVRFHRAASPTPSARWNSKTTGRSTTGTWSSWAFTIRSRSSSTGST